MELLVTIIILALIFDYINGFHDAANSIATIVSTRVLTPFQAVLWAAFFNFVAFFIAKYIIGGGHCEHGIKDRSRAVYYFADYTGRNYCGYYLELGYLVERYSLFLLAYSYWRICRSCHHG